MLIGVEGDQNVVNFRLEMEMSSGARCVSIELEEVEGRCVWANIKDATAISGLWSARLSIICASGYYGGRWWVLAG
jgi:hypothetical protein